MSSPLRAGDPDGPRALSPAIRLALEPRVELSWRPAVVAAGLIARLAGRSAYTLWPSADRPLAVVDVGYPPAAEWLQRFGFKRTRRLPDAATWSALRARVLVAGPPSGLALAAAERALGRPAREPRLALHSGTGETYLKVNCFLFERGAREPALVIKMMPDASFAPRLHFETEVVEVLRAALGEQHPEMTETLPLAPLFAGDVAGDYLVVQALDPLAEGQRPSREQAAGWLRSFQAATASGSRPWDAGDDRRELEPVADAWRRARPDREPSLSRRVAELLRELHGSDVPTCAVHGDFWLGNLACRDGRLRVYDWEWSELKGRPLFDIWMLELGDLRQRGDAGETGFASDLANALGRVQAELRERGVDERFALATLAPVLGLIAFRERRATGMPGGGEESSRKLMVAAEELLGIEAGA